MLYNKKTLATVFILTIDMLYLNNQIRVSEINNIGKLWTTA